MITGNMTTISTTGKMQSPNGIIILTGKALARSSARKNPLRAHLVAIDAQRLRQAGAEFFRLAKQHGQGPRLIEADTVGEFAQPFPQRLAGAQLQIMIESWMPSHLWVPASSLLTRSTAASRLMPASAQVIIMSMKSGKPRR